MRRVLPMLLLLVAACADPVPVVLPHDPAPAPAPAPRPAPVDPSPVPPTPVQDDAWTAATALQERVARGEAVGRAELEALYGAPARAYVAVSGLEVVTWRVRDAAGRPVLNVHAHIDRATGLAVAINPR